MKKNEKKMIGILILVSIIIIAIIYLIVRPKSKETNVKEENETVEEYVQVLEDGTKLNTSTKLQQKKKLGGLEIGNIQLTYVNGQSVVLADVVNASNNATGLMSVTLTLLDKQGNTLATVEGLVAPLQPGASTQLNIGVEDDYANAYDFTIIEN